jgi:hypothetical protein
MKRAIILVALLAAGAMPPVVAQRIKLSASLADLEKVARKDSMTRRPTTMSLAY